MLRGVGIVSHIEHTLLCVTANLALHMRVSKRNCGGSVIFWTGWRWSDGLRSGRRAAKAS